jgi:Cu+-exporting ATPase
MSVSGAQIQDGWDSSREQTRLWWTIVGLAEMNSEHPIARAILLGAKTHLGLGPDGTLEGSTGEFSTVVGKGVSATVEPASSMGRKRYHVLIGNASYLRNQGVEVASSNEEAYDDLDSPTFEGPSSSKTTQHAGITTIHTAIDGSYTGSISLSDILKPSARAAIAALQRMNITASLVTGDQAAAAQHVAALVGIPPSNVHSGVLPSGKQAIIETLQKQGHIVAMVGDGINDSPALATANVGISLASGTDVAMEAANIVLMKPNQLLDIPASLHLSKTIFRRIKANLLLSCLYNAIGLPVAMGFLLPWGIALPPLAAGAAMACSSVTVVVSSLMLRFWRRPGWMVEQEEAEFRGDVTARSGLWSFVGQARDLFRNRKTKRRDAEGERGAYVALDSYEQV